MYQFKSFVMLPIGHKFRGFEGRGITIEVTDCYYSAVSDRYIVSYKVIK